MEREILFTGIGGQGIQLMAKVLAQAAVDEGKHAMLFGLYGGAMRGGPSDSTVVIGDGPIEAPPIVPACWSIVAMYPSSLPTLLHENRHDLGRPPEVVAQRMHPRRHAVRPGAARGEVEV